MVDINVIKVFDCSGKFMFLFFFVFDIIRDVVIDWEDNVYVMIFFLNIIVFDKEGKLNRFFSE